MRLDIIHETAIKKLSHFQTVFLINQFANVNRVNPSPPPFISFSMLFKGRVYHVDVACHSKKNQYHTLLSSKSCMSLFTANFVIMRYRVWPLLY